MRKIGKGFRPSSSFQAQNLDQAEFLGGAPTPNGFLLPMGKVLHAPPSRDHRGIADIFDQKVAKSFCEIQIFFGKEIEAFDRFLAKRRRILDVPLVHFEHCTIDGGHLPTPIDHFIHILIDHVHCLFGVRHHIRPFLNHPEDRDVSIDYPGVIFADISEETAPAYEQYQECQ